MKHAAVLIVLLALVAATAEAQPPSGVARPPDENRLSLRELGAQLYAGNCASCHGIAGEGRNGNSGGLGAGDTTGLGPPLRGVGASTVDFYIRTGYMPLETPYEQPWRRRV